MAKAYTKGLLPPPGPQGGYQDPRGRFITAQEAQAMGYGVPGLNAPAPPEPSASYRFGQGLGRAIQGAGQFLNPAPEPGDIDYGPKISGLGEAFTYPARLLMRALSPVSEAETNAYQAAKGGQPGEAALQGGKAIGAATGMALLPEASKLFGPFISGIGAGAAYQLPGAAGAIKRGNLAGAAGQLLGGATIGAGLEKGGEAANEISTRARRMMSPSTIRDVAANNAVAHSVNAVGALQQSLLKVKGTVDGYYQTIADRMGPEPIIDQSDMTKAITNDPSPRISWNEAKEARTKIGYVLNKAEEAAPSTDLRQKLPEIRESYNSITKQLRSTAEEQGMGDVWQQANDLHKQRLRAQKLLPGNPQNPASVSFASHDPEAVLKAFKSLSGPDRNKILNDLQENYGLDKNTFLKEIKHAEYNRNFAKSGAMSGLGVYSHPARMVPYVGLMLATHSWPLALGSALVAPELQRWFKAAGEEPMSISGGAFGLNPPVEIPPEIARIAQTAEPSFAERLRNLPPIKLSPLVAGGMGPESATPGGIEPQVVEALHELQREGKLTTGHLEDLRRAIEAANAQSSKARARFRTAEAVAAVKRAAKR